VIAPRIRPFDTMPPLDARPALSLPIPDGTLDLMGRGQRRNSREKKLVDGSPSCPAQRSFLGMPRMT